jgi:L-2-hydroxyglutarate oxidase LhgO
MTKTDVVLIGAGIMSATLGTLLRLVEPDWSITLIERLDGVAAESSDPWHKPMTNNNVSNTVGVVNPAPVNEASRPTPAGIAPGWR